jgi:WD repeat-containing protein 7
MSGTDDDRLFCNGYYAEILIMDPFSLEILFSLASRVNPDWISTLHVLRPAKRKGDFLMLENLYLSLIINFDQMMLFWA